MLRLARAASRFIAEDAFLAIGSLLWILIATVAVPAIAGPASWTGPLLVFGLSLILAATTRRRAGRGG